MHFDDQNYRLPTEARTKTIQITHGCSYNKCNYCSLYYKTPFGLCDKSEIISDLKTLADQDPNTERLYLMNGDPFCLDTKVLLEIIELSKSYLPRLRSFSMFASVLNVENKTDSDLELLREAGITDLYMGSESFHDPSLDLAGVGYRSEDSLRALARLERSGIEYSLMMILGLSGSLGDDKAKEIGKTNGLAMSKTNPKNIAITTLFVPNNSVYGKMKREGKFTEATEIEKMLELGSMFENLDKDFSAYFYSFHGVSSNDLDKFYKSTGDKEAFKNLFKFYSLKGNLPQDQKMAITVCQKAALSLRKHPNFISYPWFVGKKRKFKKSEINSENPIHRG